MNEQCLAIDYFKNTHFYLYFFSLLTLNLVYCMNQLPSPAGLLGKFVDESEVPFG